LCLDGRNIVKWMFSLGEGEVTNIDKKSNVARRFYSPRLS